MGQKVHPVGFRLGVTRTWDAKWYADKNYTTLLKEDMALRNLVRQRLANASVSRIEIERAANQVTVTVHTARPGIVIGKSGQAVEELRQMLARATHKNCRLNVIEIRNPELDAYLVARNVADQLEKRVAYRRALKQAVQRTMRAGARGVKIVAGGRLGGNEIASRFKESQGSVPLQTLRADIDYGFAAAHTTFGVIGIKVWIYKGNVRRDGQRPEPQPAQQPFEGDRVQGRGRGAGGRGPRGGPARPGSRSGPPRVSTPQGSPNAEAANEPRSAGGVPPAPSGTTP